VFVDTFGFLSLVLFVILVSSMSVILLLGIALLIALGIYWATALEFEWGTGFSERKRQAREGEYTITHFSEEDDDEKHKVLNEPDTKV